jgi:hypothetical protein
MTSLSYETKWNNLQHDNSKPVTTFNTFNGSVTMFPGLQLPTFTLGYGFITRKNPIDLSTFYSTNKPVLMDRDTLNNLAYQLDTTRFAVINSSNGINTADEITHRFFIATNYDFTLGMRHSATATLSLANKKDNTFYKRDQDNISVSTSLTTTYKIPLQTTLSIIVSHNATYASTQDSTKAYFSNTQQQTFNYQTISFGARYRLLQDRLNLLATVAPSFGDFKRFLIQAGADFQIKENHFLTGQLDFIQNPDNKNDVLASLVYRFMF